MKNIFKTTVSKTELKSLSMESYYPTTKDCIGNIYEFSSSLLEDGVIKSAEYKNPTGNVYKTLYTACLCNGKMSWFNVNRFHSAYRCEDLRGKPAKLGLISKQHYDNMLITLLVLAGKKLEVVDMKKVYKRIGHRRRRITTYEPVFKMI